MWLDPIACQIGPFKIYWYGIAYIIGLATGWKYALFLVEKYKLPFNRQILEKYLTWIVLSMIIGGRLGHVIFYEFSHFLKRPLEIFMTWKGGMSFHGAFLGISLSTLIFCHRFKIPFWKLCDLSITVAPFGLGLGRLANFINQELYGRITNVPWAVTYPKVDMFPRHPTQIYEALGEGLFLMILLSFTYKHFFKKPGFQSGLFLVSYALIRFLIEFFKEPESLIWLGYFFSLTVGQLLCFPMVFLGVYLIKRPSPQPSCL